MKPYCSLFLLVSLFLLPFLSWAQQLDYFVAPTHTNKIVAIGDHLWMCTNSGLVQLNLEGEVIKHHHIQAGFLVGLNNIDYLFQDKQGKLYARVYNITGDDHVVYQKNEEDWVRSEKYSQKHIFLLPFNEGHFGYYDKKKKAVFIEQEKGWLKKKVTIQWYEDEVEEELAMNPLILNSAVYIEKSDELWITSHHGVFRLTAGKIKNYKCSSIDLKMINNLCQDNLGNVHLFTSYWGVYYILDTEADTFQLCSEENTYTVTLFIGKDKTVYKLDRKNHQIHEFGDANNRLSYLGDMNPETWAAKDRVIDGIADKNGTLWLATFNGNLYQSNENSFRYISLIDSLAYERQRKLCGADILLSKDENVLVAGVEYFKGNSAFLNTTNAGQKVSLFDKFTEKENFFFAAAMSSITAIDVPLEMTLEHISKNYDLDKILSEEYYLKYAYYDAERECIIFCNGDATCYIISPEGIVARQDYDSHQDKWLWGFFAKMYYSSTTASFWMYNSVDFYRTTLQGDTIVTINFDSTSFPIEEEIRGIYEDQQHQIWVQTKVAVYRYTNNHWTRFDHKVLGLKKEPLLFDAIFREDAQGNLLLLTKQGLIKWDGQQWSTELLWKGAIKKAKPTKFWLDGDTIWIAGLHQGVYTINRKNPKQVTIISSTLSIEDWSKEEKTAVVWLLLSYGEGVCKYVP